MKKLALCFLTLTLLLRPALSFSDMVFEKSEYAARRAKLMEKIPDGVAIVLGTTSQTGYYPFFQNNDFLYFSGVDIPNAILLIDGHQKQSTLFYTITEREARNEGIDLNLVRKPVEVTGIENVLPLEQFSSTLVRGLPNIQTIYTSFSPEELHRECTSAKLRILRNTMTLNPWDGRLTRELQFVKLLRERFSQVEVKDCARMIWDLRIIKSPAEIELLRKIGRIGVKAHIELMKAARPGMHEYELSALYKYFCEKEGAQDLAYYTIISSGPNHPYLHYYKHDRVLEDGDILVIDVGPDMHNYDVDISVTFPANGKFTPRQREVYEAANALQKACMSLYRPGVTVDEVREKAAEMLRRQGFDLTSEIFKQRSMRGGFGHYVGMAVHDVGGRPTILKPGMVFANDRYAVFPDENLGVRVEDTVLITENGCENLTPGIPREVEEIEALMKKAGAIQVLQEAKIY
jgi:Xaa-Pro aminopeptidase